MGDSTEDRTTKDDELFNSEYANNTFFESTIWDLKILFGEFSSRSNAVDWHTSITLPWAQAKLMAFYLMVNVRVHEIQHGDIKIPDQVIPKEPPPPPDSSKDDPVAQAMYQMFKEEHKKFVESLKK